MTTVSILPRRLRMARDVARLHLGDDEDVLADVERGEVGQLSRADVAPRHELEEVGDAQQTLGAGQLLGLVLLDELGQRRVLGEHRHRHSTPSSTG